MPTVPTLRPAADIAADLEIPVAPVTAPVLASDLVTPFGRFSVRRLRAGGYSLWAMDVAGGKILSGSASVWTDSVDVTATGDADAVRASLVLICGRVYAGLSVLNDMLHEIAPHPAR